MTEARKWTAEGPDGYGEYWVAGKATDPKGREYSAFIVKDIPDAETANLIAAAPDLAKAGKTMCDALEASWNETDEIPGFAELKAALAKARGSDCAAGWNDDDDASNGELSQDEIDGRLGFEIDPAPSGPVSERPCPWCAGSGAGDFEVVGNKLFRLDCSACHGTGWIETEDGE